MHTASLCGSIEGGRSGFVVGCLLCVGALFSCDTATQDFRPRVQRLSPPPSYTRPGVCDSAMSVAISPTHRDTISRVHNNKRAVCDDTSKPYGSDVVSLCRGRLIQGMFAASASGQKAFQWHPLRWVGVGPESSKCHRRAFCFRLARCFFKTDMS